MEEQINETTPVYERIVLELEDPAGRPIKKAFVGRYVIEEFGTEYGGWRVIETAQKRIVVVRYNLECGESMAVHESFNEFAGADYPGELVSAVAAEVDVDYIQELDI